MEMLFRHIEYLLVRHDCVVVPGLGAFIANTLPGNIDMENGIFSPSIRSVGFNQDVSIDDGMLANSIMRESGVNHKDARESIINMVGRVKENLFAGEIIKVGKTGTLTQDSFGNLIFTPLMNPDRVSESLGFSKVSLNRHLKRGDAVSPEKSILLNISDKRTLGFRKTITRIAAAVFLVLAVAIAVILNPEPADNLEQRASVVPVETIKNIASKVVEPTPAVAMTEPHPLLEETVTNTESKYFLIVGTFSSEKEAERFVEMKSTEEYKLRIVPSRKMFRVSVADSDDFQVLRKRLNSRDISDNFPQSWIWTK